MHARHSLRGAALAAAIVVGAGGFVLHAQRGGAPQPPVRPHTNDVNTTYTHLPLAPADQKYAGARRRADEDSSSTTSPRSRASRTTRASNTGGASPARRLTPRWRSTRRNGSARSGLQDVRMQPFNLPPQWFALDWDVTRNRRRPDAGVQDSVPERPIGRDASRRCRSRHRVGRRGHGARLRRP